MEQRNREEQLVAAVKALLSAINQAQEVGCIEHTDSWGEAEELFYGPIKAARKLVKPMNKEEIKKDLMALCSKHDIEMYPYEDEPYTVISCGNGETFSFDYITGTEFK